jgi:hypothetical protein
MIILRIPRFLPPIPPKRGLKKERFLKPPLGVLGVKKNKGRKEKFEIES